MGRAIPVDTSERGLLPSLPLPVWMVLITIVFGLGAGMSAPELIGSFNKGFGLALGEFALILLPSFTLAAAMEQRALAPDSSVAVLASPAAGAGMICPDTAYAALSPIAGDRKLDVAFGAYTGFKLLYPAGPLIVATGLGVESDAIVIAGLALAVPVWASGLIWRRLVGSSESSIAPIQKDATASPGGLSALLPFAVLAGLLVLGIAPQISGTALLEFLTGPKGALLAAALLALIMVDKEKRRACLDSAVRRTGGLLLLIGCASAFGTVLTQNLPLSDILPGTTGVLGILSLFLLSGLFKLIQGSSMATFAAVAPVAAPIVTELGLPGVAAVFAICLGSFIAILPNDSFYWIVRTTGFTEGQDRSLAILSAGSLVQALVGLLLLITAILGGLI